MRHLKSVGRIILINILVLSVLLICFEGLLILLFSNPHLLNGALNRFYREYHVKYERNIIQLLPQCARYDRAILYTLKPGTCRFINREFDSEFRINSLGIRDDESSLHKPQIVVLGDSHAMGWGVEQEEAFPQLLETMSKKRTLNAAVSSYGTAREMIMLERIDTSNLQYLIIQYAANDYQENKSYYENDNVLEITEEAEYNRLVNEHITSPKYRFGRYTYELQKKVVNGLIKKSGVKKLRSIMFKTNDTQTIDEEVDVFINALSNANVHLDGIKIIVFEVNFHAINDSRFINDLKRHLATKSYRSFIENMYALDLSSELRKGKYCLTWDGHTNPSGHKFIAESLLPLLQS